MKALPYDYQDKRKNNHSVMVLLPSGKLETGIGDPANIALELDGDNIRVWIMCIDEIASFRLVKEVEVSGRFLIEALEYRNARVAYEIKKLEFKNQLQNLMLTKNCDAYSFLEMGDVVL